MSATSIISAKKLVQYSDSAAVQWARKDKETKSKFTTKIDSAVHKAEVKQEIFNNRDLEYAELVLKSITKFCKEKKIVQDIINNATERQSFTKNELNMLSYIYTKNLDISSKK